MCRFFFIAESPLQGFHLNGFSHKQWHNFRGEGQFNSRRYSAIGLDTDRLQNEHFVHSYFRVRWLGDGSVRCGAGAKQYAFDEEEFDALDLAGRWMEKPRLNLHRPARFGFGFWRKPEDFDSREGKPLWAWWISVPAWFPGIVMLAIGMTLHKRTTQTKGTA